MGTLDKFEDIEAWKLARVLSNEIFNLTKKDFFDEDKKLKYQMNGSSGSMMDNIAEGFGRGGNKEFSQFLWISKGSTAELKSQLYRCLDRNWIDSDYFNNLYNQADTIEKMISGLFSYLSKSDNKGRKYKNR
ncbi:MAG: four helix bundle protein [Bacteroidetes bacterium]|nr:four helix bundle protein [Bacteroidota bacterium]